MIFSGQILKMKTVLGNPIQYYLNLSQDIININQLIEKKIKLSHTGYQCVSCNSNVTLFRMGFCKKCFFESPYASESIIRPELSTAHLDIEERNLEIEKEIQLVPHIVYLAYTGDIKVGVTREHQVPTRWIDQGATSALPIAKTKNRFEAGIIEVALKKHLSDKTNFRKMLQTANNQSYDLTQTRNSLKDFFPKEFSHFYLDTQEEIQLNYPYSVPEKINSFTLEKEPIFEGILKGIKGQYLCFDHGNCINVRSHEGYAITLETYK